MAGQCLQSSCGRDVADRRGVAWAMSRVDLYRVLNLSKGATLQEIKGAYRTLAKIHHPDLCTTDKKVAEDTFKKLSAAYQTLSNARTKAVYDMEIGNYGSRRGQRGPNAAPRSTQVRNPATGATVTRDHFDVKAWNAAHYGAEDNPRQTQASVSYTDRWTDPSSAHQSYYRRKAAREEAEAKSGVKWTADDAYAASQGSFGSEAHSASEESEKSEESEGDAAADDSSRAESKGSTRTGSGASSSRGSVGGSRGGGGGGGGAKSDFRPGSASFFGEVLEQKRQHVQSAADNLRKRRTERIQRAAGAPEVQSCSLS